MEEGLPCPGYGLPGCPDRYQCYRNQGVSPESVGAQCMCSRIFMSHGEDCQETDSFVYLSSALRIIFVVQVIFCGWKALLILLRRRQNTPERKSMSLTAICACSWQLSSDSCLFVSAVIDLIRLWVFVGNWYKDYGESFIKSLMAGLSLLTIISVSHHFFEKVTEAGFIGQKMRMVTRIIFFSFQVAIPSVALWSQLVQPNEKFYLLFVSAGLFGLASLTLTGTAVLRLTRPNAAAAAARRRRAGSSSPPAAAVSTLRRFTRRYASLVVLVLAAYMALRALDQAGGAGVPAWAPHLAYQAMAACHVLLSRTVYRFLLPPEHQPPAPGAGSLAGRRAAAAEWAAARVHAAATAGRKRRRGSRRRVHAAAAGGEEKKKKEKEPPPLCSTGRSSEGTARPSIGGWASSRHSLHPVCEEEGAAHNNDGG